GPGRPPSWPNGQPPGCGKPNPYADRGRLIRSLKEAFPVAAHGHGISCRGAAGLRPVPRRHLSPSVGSRWPAPGPYADRGRPTRPLH
ncbi:MAG: hypothetical protein M3Y81_25690, partial [Chloroflexota bacterium]|nr:hypothetical protein [Chloroflexota bacterium]